MAWKPSDRTLASAWLAYRRSFHSACGHPIEESFSDEADERKPTKRRYCYEAVKHVCHACAAEQKKRDDMTAKGESLAGVVITSVRVPLKSAQSPEEAADAR